jgi:hypothetical protein
MAFDVLTNATTEKMSFACVSPMLTLACRVDPASVELSGSQVSVSLFVTSNTESNAARGTVAAGSNPAGGPHTYELQIIATVGGSAETVSVPVVVTEPPAPVLSKDKKAVATGASKVRTDESNSILFAIPDGTEAPPSAKAKGVGFSVESVDFGTVPVGTSSVAREVTLKNFESSPLGIDEIRTTSEFVQANTCTSELKPGESCKATVSFKPTAAGIQKGQLSIKTASGTAVVNLIATAQ